MTVRRYASLTDADRHDAEYWQPRPAAETASCWCEHSHSSSGGSPDGFPMNPDFVDLLRAFCAAIAPRRRITRA